jgi:hypothetical protein
MMPSRQEVPAIDRIQELLASAVAPGSFATRQLADAGDLRLDVTGVGPIPLPLSPTIARKVCKVARPARYGLREQTLLDPKVRDTWEIAGRQLRIDERRWQRTLAPQLERIARDLGVPAGGKLRAELHNLLVYGPGQFFAPHQDSEKADGMIGSLVVLLPSEAKGGALVIEHHDEKVSYRGSPDRVVLVAFYSDCRHEVRPITAGYRAALTYNLFVDGARVPARPTGRPVDALVELVRGHFATPRPAYRPGAPSAGCPERLVYLLDHEYTQKGLSWRALKNGDAVRTALFREVAERLDCEIVLALADVHEMWSCEDDWDDGYRYGRRSRGWYGREDDNEDEGDRDEGDHTLIELCDSELELRHWVTLSGKSIRALSDEVLGDEVCYTKPSVDLQPFKSEHEGYTGNAGNTVDRWYHRAAVLMWPRTRTFAIRARAAPPWAIREIAKTLARGKSDEARDQIFEMLPFWTEVAQREETARFIDQVLHVAAELDDAELARSLIEPIAIERITPQVAPRWIDLLARYGRAWCSQVFERWTSRAERAYDYQPRATWLASLPAFCAPLSARGGEDAVQLVRGIASAQWTWLDKQLGRLCNVEPASNSTRLLVAMSRSIVALLATAALVDDVDLQAAIVVRMTAARGYPSAAAVAVLRTAAAHGGAMLGLGPLYEDCVRTVSARVEAPPRAPGDWSIVTPFRCKCELCARLGQFLRAGAERQLDWPLAKDRRAHVHQTITSHEIPVTHVTQRVGSPHRLVLTKTNGLFTRDVAERASWTRDLAWLRRTAKTFAAQRERSMQRRAPSNA